MLRARLTQFGAIFSTLIGGTLVFVFLLALIPSGFKVPVLNYNLVDSYADA